MRLLCAAVFLWGIFPGTAAAQEEPTEPPSLWTVLEAGMVGPISVEEEEASLELLEARSAEQAYLDGGERPGEPDAAMYEDPQSVAEAVSAAPFDLDPTEFDIPVTYNANVQKWMDYFQGRGKTWFTRYLERKAAWEPMIHAVMDEAGLPRDLIHVAMIESGFSNHAHSHAAAVGMWQFIASAGRGYGLRVDYWLDERKDPFLATQAASRFYTDLHRQFEDWWLAMAAYNTGPGRVRRAVRNEGTRDYWELVDKKALHPETRDYVGKIIAAAILAKSPEQFGFEVNSPQEPWEFEEVEVEGSVSIPVIAECAGADVENIETLNPKLLRGATPPQVTTVIRIPVGSKERFSEQLASLPEEERLSYARHTVARGEALSLIAERYGVTTDSIVAFNRLENANRIRVGMELVIPVPMGPGEASSQTSSARTGTAQRRPVTIRIQAGDNISTLAETHGVTSSEIMEWNGITDPNRLQVGQEIRLYGEAQTVDAQPTSPRTYTVASGDSLYSIARAHGLSVGDLKAFNGLRSNTIQPGQVLKLGAE
ncbi:MAG: LysM peptidoglycan-binding domain-containing protein [Myxococcota bacterium]|nr:LysM peptidoglycan-binding domain-containing protein [Myxococcota bacterium]